MRALRGVAAGALTLIVIQAFGSGQGPVQGGKLLVWVAGGIRKALSPEVAAIPYAGKAAPISSAPKTSGTAGTLPKNPVIWT